MIDAILHIDRPRNATELCMFIGCINYYRDMCPSCAHTLIPLTDQSSLKKKAPIKWTDKMQKAFDQMRLLMLPMFLQHIWTTISGLTYTLMPLTQLTSS